MRKNIFKYLQNEFAWEHGQQSDGILGFFIKAMPNFCGRIKALRLGMSKQLGKIKLGVMGSSCGPPSLWQ